MLGIPGIKRFPSLGLPLLLIAAVGCGPAEVASEQAGAIPVYNPSPDNPTKDVTLENESENIGKIGGISK